MNTLEALFDELAGKGKALRCATAYQDYLVCGKAVLQRPTQPDSPAPGRQTAYNGHEQGHISSIQLMLPEVVVAPLALRLTGEDREAVLRADSLLVCPNAAGRRIFLLPRPDKDAPRRFAALGEVQVPEPADLGDVLVHLFLGRELKAACLEHPEVKVSLCRMLGAEATLIVVLEHEAELMYVLQAKSDAPDIETVELSGKTYRPDAWNDKNRCWKHLKAKEKKKMKGLGNPVQKKEVPPEVAAVVAEMHASAEQDAAAPAAEADAAVDAAVEAAASVDVGVDIADDAAAEPAAVQATADTPAEVPVEEPPAEPSQPAKAQRQRRTAQAAGKYGVQVLQQLAADIAAQPDPSDVEQIDASIDELRALRDLQIASSRRMANLGTAIAKLTRGAVEKYAQIKKLL